MKPYIIATAILSVLTFGSCKDNDNTDPGEETLSEEYYTGGKLGTTFVNDISSAYEQPTPVVSANANMSLDFLLGEAFFEKEFTSNTSGVRHGLGPAYVRSSCISCHPGYGHGKRMDRYSASDFGNGYLLVVIDQGTHAYVPELTGMPQTRATYPFLPPVDEQGIKITWVDYTDEFGNTFPDGETYSLIYPEVTIDPAYINTDPKPTNYTVRLEATIGIYGTGLLDAIPDDSIIAEYNKQKALGMTLNDALYTDETKLITENDGSKRLRKFTYGLSRATIQNGPGANAIWNITNVTRTNRRSNYITTAYATAMSKNTNVQAVLGKNEATIYNELMATDLTPELSTEDYINFMIWHRGLAVPAARNLGDADVQRGKKIFNSIGCTSCHRPSWTTGPDDYTGDTLVVGKLPRYPYQKIWPYTDMLQHKLDMVNDIRTGWCRTTPLWGRGLSQLCTGASEHLHDMRARNYVEAIMWHGGDAAQTRSNFRTLSKKDRDALVKFLESL
ncbi:MAG: di-heme oxidoredictase family protein [Breznakibacter sp.]